jgi:hypothetical protein
MPAAPLGSMIGGRNTGISKYCPVQKLGGGTADGICPMSNGLAQHYTLHDLNGPAFVFPLAVIGYLIDAAT